MGFFSLRKKKLTIDDATPISPASGVTTDLGVGASIDGDGDYVAPTLDDVPSGSGGEAPDDASPDGAVLDDAAMLAPSAPPPGSSVAAVKSLPVAEVSMATGTASGTGSRTDSGTASGTEPESLEEGYVEAGATGDMPSEEEAFDGLRGTVQEPRHRDVGFAVMFGLHLVVLAWWFAESFGITFNGQNYANYAPLNHSGIAGFVLAMFFTGLLVSFLAFAYMLRHGETMLKTTIIASLTLCFGVGIWGVVMWELFMAACGFAACAIASVYANIVWIRIPFTAVNLSAAITAVRKNMGLFLAAIVVAIVGFAWLILAVIGGLSGYRSYGGWTVAYSVFSYYWTHQVLTNVMSVTTAGIIGRWLVVGESTPHHSAGLKETLARSSTYSFGSICCGSLFLRLVQLLSGLNSFLSPKGIPLLPKLLDWILVKIRGVVDATSEWAYVYIGLYGYSYNAAARNITRLFENKEWDTIINYHLARNSMFMACTAIGLITGFVGLLFGRVEYLMMLESGFENPESDDFFVGFLVGFLVSSITLSVVTATINTIIVCLAESPADFNSNHPDMSEALESAWKEKISNVQKFDR